MKSTGIVRRIDKLGRVVLPTELRRSLHLDWEDPIEIFVDGEHIILRKYQPGCLFCGGLDEVVTHNGASVCRSCIRELEKKLS